jgi:hypothetical protein
MSRIRVSVRHQHILAGRRSSRFHCPIALAIKDLFPGATVVVQLDTIRINGVPYPTPKRAAAYMGYYDTTPRKEDVKPINFTLHGNRPDDIHFYQRDFALTRNSTLSQIEVACGRKLQELKIGPFPIEKGRELSFCSYCQKKQDASKPYTYHVRGTVVR